MTRAYAYLRFPVSRLRRAHWHSPPWRGAIHFAISDQSVVPSDTSCSWLLNSSTNRDLCVVESRFSSHAYRNLYFSQIQITNIGHTGPYLTIYWTILDHICPYLAILNHTRLYFAILVIFNHTCLYLSILGHIELYLAIFDHICPY